MDPNSSNSQGRKVLRRYDLLGSMNQATNPFLMPDSDFTYLLNVSQDEFGSIQKDGGYSIFNGVISGSGVNHYLADYVKSDGTHRMVRVDGGTAYISDVTETGWTALTGTTFTSGIEINGINFLDRHYFAASDKNLQYTAGATLVDVASENGGVNVKGKYLAVIGEILFLGHLTTQHKKNQVVYTTAGTSKFYKATDASYASTTNIVTVDGQVTGLRAYQGMLYIFTDQGLWFHDPVTFETRLFYKHGTTAAQTIQELWGNLVWADRDGVHMFSGAGVPQNISRQIQNKSNNAIWELIDGTNWTKLRGGVYRDKYYLFVGDFTATIPGDDEALDDVVLVYDYPKASWTMLDKHPVSYFATYINLAGDEELYFGSRLGRAVFKRDFSYSKQGIAISMVIRTKYFDGALPEYIKTWENLFVTYRPTEEDKFLNVAIAVNGSNLYVDKITDASAMKLELNGSTGYSHITKHVNFSGVEGHNASFEFSNDDDEVNAKLLGYTVLYRVGQINMNVST